MSRNLPALFQERRNFVKDKISKCVAELFSELSEEDLSDSDLAEGHTEEVI